jgi:hypothetical protein
LGVTALLLASGTVGDLRGHKRIVLMGLAAFRHRLAAAAARSARDRRRRQLTEPGRARAVAPVNK